jgi:competence protein ComEC
MVSCDVGQGDATVIRSRGLIAVVDVGREPKPIDSCLRQLGISQVDLLVLTHFDLDHVAGLAGLLGHRTVKLAMLTSFVDNRPGADAARRALDDRRVPIVEAETGLQGRLGSFRWQVLSPHLGAPEAEDSNDGSITMLWRTPKVDIITLADLGQKGQMRLLSESTTWMDAQLASVPLVMKVSHHGSADQSPGLIQALSPSLATVSVGRGNTYGHPTKRTLDLLGSMNCWVARTDEHGSIAIALDGDGFALGFQGEQGKTG